MRTIRLFLALAAICCTAVLQAQNLYDASGGTIIGRIQGNRIYDASGGTTIGQIQGERITNGSGSQTLNQLKSNGTVTDGSGGRTVGIIKSNGQVMDGSGGRTLGYVENGNVYDSSHGRKIGSYSGVDKNLVAYYYFFFPNKNSKPASKPATKPATKPTTQAKNTTPQQSGVRFFNRNKQQIGVLYGDNRYVSNSGVEFLFKKTNEGITITRNGVYVFNVDQKGNVFHDNGKRLFCRIDNQGNAIVESGIQYGKIADDGMLYGTPSLDYPFGYVPEVSGRKFTVALVFFVCLYNNLLHSYLKADEKAAEQQ